MPPIQLDFRYVETFLKNVGVRITLEPGQYFVMRKATPKTNFTSGPWHERRGFDALHEAFIYGLQLALLPPFYYRASKWVRRSETAEEKSPAGLRRKAMINAELQKLEASF